MAEAADEVLTPDDATKIVEELLPAQNKSHLLGLKLNLPQYEVEAIHSRYIDPLDRLLQVITEFLRQTVTPRPTWRVIVEALRSPLVNLPDLARRVEAAHFPDPASIPQNSGTAESALQSQVNGFHRRFNIIKTTTITSLIVCQITVASMVFWLTSIRALDEHRVFLEENLEALGQCPNHWVLFGKLNFYWNYLAYDLLFQLIEVLATQYDRFKTTGEDMAAYKRDIKRFRSTTSLRLFCETEIVPFSSQTDPPPGFRDMVVKFDWSENVTLEEVEWFRRRYCQLYRLERCAMMVNSIRPGSFIVTWFVPISIIKALSRKGDKTLNLFVEFGVARLEIAGDCLYQAPAELNVAPLLIATSSASLSVATSSATRMELKPAKFPARKKVHEQGSSLVRAGEYFVEHKQEIILLLKRYKVVECLILAKSDYQGVIQMQQVVTIGVTAAVVAGGAVGVLAFGALVFGVLVFGVIGFAVGAMVAGGLWYGIRGGRQLRSEADKAKQAIHGIEGKVSDRKRSIQREDETRIKRMISFFKKLQEFIEVYENVSEKCDDQAALAQKLDEMYGREGAYRLYDSRGTRLVNLSFKDALAAFIEMTEKGSRYVFSVRFHCDICKYQRLEFPYVISDKPVCAKCYTEVQF